ncbi:MAG: LuxR C-terminal-related transcriptional regulator [Cellulomonas sp.]|nr:LuxR C-terminal-related transcriptional regulator [Cellulomonas sp.]MCR6649333.1 LuxR C-terminal-related transcriptional regulator [Cellulomonas sp.]
MDHLVVRRVCPWNAARAGGRSNPDVADQLGVGEATVKAHVHALLRKLGCTTRTQLVVAAYESGLITVGH